MKVCIINTSERDGGAAVAANRLLQALSKTGLDVRMLVRDKRTDHQNVYTVNTTRIRFLTNRLRFLFERFIIFLCNRFSRTNLFQVSIANTGTDISRLSLLKEADIIHLHWVNQGFLSLSDIKKIVNSGKPVVWTLHDLWPATGICHYPGDCNKYKVACSDCPLMPDALSDLAKSTFLKKSKCGFDRIHFVGCSQWIADKARESALLQHAAITSIPNPIDTAVFCQTGKQEARQHFRLDESKRYILFGAAKLTDKRKGFSYLKEACLLLSRQPFSQHTPIELLLMGNASDELSSSFPFPVRSLGFIESPAEQALAYSAADLFVIPSLEDNLPNTIMEAMACGTPCAGFHTGGIPEMISHKTNGYIAEYKDAEDLARGIQWVLENSLSLQLSAACIQSVRNYYAEPVVAEQYISLYKRLLE